VKKNINVTGTKEEAALRKELNTISEKLGAMMQAYQKVENADYLGKCYKYASKDETNMTRYFKVIGADGKNLTVFTFSRAGIGKDQWFHSQINTEYRVPDFWEPISYGVYKRNWELFVSSVKKQGDRYL
jgi:hypothetical protein